MRVRSPADSEPMITALTFNIRYGRAADGANAWRARRAAVIARIRAHAPDLLALQECEEGPQAAYVRAGLPDYHFIGHPRGGGDETAAEMAPVLLRRAAFALEDSGRFWLSETPDLPGSRSWGAQFARTLTWARLQHRASGQRLIFASTHFDLVEDAIIEQARVLAAWARRAAGDFPLLIGGDFNTPRDGPAYRILTAEAGLRDTLRDRQPPLADEGTFHGFGTVTPRPSIDFVLASPGLRTLRAEIDTTASPAGRYPSDHFPVLAEVVG